MIKNIKILIFILPIILSFRVCYGETPLSEKLFQSWRWASYDIKDGLFSNNVLCITEANDKTIWALTDKGLNYFDGFQWIQAHPYIYNSTSSVLLSYGKESILAINHQRIFIFDKQHKDSLIIYYKGKELEIHEMSSIYNNIFLFKTNINGEWKFFSYNISNYNLEEIYIPQIYCETLKKYYSNFRNFENGIVGLINDNGIYLYKEGKFLRNCYNFDKHNDFPYLMRGVYNDKDKIFFSIVKPEKNIGLWEYNFKTSTSKQILPYKDYTSLVIYDKSNYILFNGSDITDIFENNHIINLKKNLIELESPQFVFVSSNKNLWISGVQGIKFCNLSSNKWNYISLNKSSGSKEVNEIIDAQNGEKLVASASGVFSIDKYNTQFKELNKKALFLTGLQEDKNRNLWMSSGGTFTGTLFYDRIKKQIKFYNETNGFNAKNIHKIFKDSKERLWFLVLNASLDTNANSLICYDNSTFIEYGSKDGLKCERFYSMCENSKGELFFGGVEGIFKFDEKSFTKVCNPYGIVRPEVFVMACSKNDEIYFASRDSKIMKYANGKAELVDILDSAKIDKVWDMEFDKKGALWISSKAGIYRYFNECVAHIDKAQGLLKSYVWAIQIDSNKAYFGVNGSDLHQLNFDEINYPAPRIVVEPPFTQERFASFSWSVFPFYNEQIKSEVKVRYKIDNEEWHFWNTKRTCSFSGLSAGKHIFYIQSMNFFGELDGAVYQIEFYIPPPIYARSEFYVPVAFSFALVCGMIIAYQRKRLAYIRNLTKINSNMDALLSNTPDALILLNKNGEIELFNNSAFNKLQLFYSSEIEIGSSFIKFLDEKRRELWIDYFRKALQGNSFNIDFTIEKDQKNHYFESLYFPIFVKNEIVGVGLFIRLITERIEMENKIKSSLREKEILLKEIHHRVKNNLLVVSNLLGLHTFANLDIKTLEVIENARSRIISMSLIHESLYKEDNLEQINFGDYSKTLLESIKQSYKNKDCSVSSNIDAPINLQLSTAMTCGLILNELAMNSFKYAFKNRESGIIRIQLKKDNEYLYFEYSDDGDGLPDDYESSKSPSLGMFLIKELAQNQLNGTLEIINKPGLTYKIKFKNVEQKTLVSPIL